jgi:hypothetical protein
MPTGNSRFLAARVPAYLVGRDTVREATQNWCLHQLTYSNLLWMINVTLIREFLTTRLAQEQGTLDRANRACPELTGSANSDMSSLLRAYFNGQLRSERASISFSVHLQGMLHCSADIWVKLEATAHRTSCSDSGEDDRLS